MTSFSSWRSLYWAISARIRWFLTRNFTVAVSSSVSPSLPHIRGTSSAPFSACPLPKDFPMSWSSTPSTRNSGLLTSSKIVVSRKNSLLYSALRSFSSSLTANKEWISTVYTWYMSCWTLHVMSPNSGIHLSRNRSLCISCRDSNALALPRIFRNDAAASFEVAKLSSILERFFIIRSLVKLSIATLNLLQYSNALIIATGDSSNTFSFASVNAPSHILKSLSISFSAAQYDGDDSAGPWMHLLTIREEK